MKNLLLRLLNYMENTPSYYARIDNIEHYSKEFLLSFPQDRTLAEFMEAMGKMDKCMRSGKDCFIDEGVVHNNVDLTMIIGEDSQ